MKLRSLKLLVLSLLVAGLTHPVPAQPAPPPLSARLVAVSDRSEILERADRAEDIRVKADEARFYAWAASQPVVVEPPKPASRPRVRQEGTEAAATEESQHVAHFDPGSVQQIIVDVFGPRAPLALEVARCESGYDPTARNKSGASGVYQIVLPLHAEKFEAHGWSADDWADPYKNITIAFEMSGGGVSWGPWNESRHCWG